jgi:hypothetical protein
VRSTNPCDLKSCR